MEENLKITYNEISNIDTQNIWKQYLYDQIEMEPHQNIYDCAFNCKNVHKNIPCDMFVVLENVCYLGKSTYTSGNLIQDSVADATVYITSGSFNFFSRLNTLCTPLPCTLVQNEIVLFRKPKMMKLSKCLKN